MTPEPVDIRTYEDYRLFLRDLHAEVRTQKPTLSQAYYAKRLGVSRGFISLVWAKKRHVAPDKLGEICAMFELEEGRRDRFLLLYLKTLLREDNLRERVDRIMDSVQ